MRRPARSILVALLVGAALAASTTSASARLPSRPPAPSCGGETVTKPSGASWQCTFDDEFSGNSLDTSKWSVVTTATSGYHSGPECFVNTANNVSVANGYLSLTARQERAPFTCSDPWGNYTTQYTSGEVSSAGKFSQTAGRFEVRAAFPPATIAGLQSSLWLYPVNSTIYGSWPTSGEIDIAEEYSQYPDRAIPYIHYTAATPDPNVTNTNCLISNVNAMHTYVLTWTATTMTISYDGATCIKDTWNPAAPLLAPQPFDQPFAVDLTQALGINTNAFIGGTTPLPATTEVDYVRIWK